jgi:hypothetical protein
VPRAPRIIRLAWRRPFAHHSTPIVTRDTLATSLAVASMDIRPSDVTLPPPSLSYANLCRLRLKCDGTRAETRFRPSAKRTSPFKSAGASVQSTTGSRGVRISGSNAGYTMFRGDVRVLATHSIRQFSLYFFTRASTCVITFQLDCTSPPSWSNFVSVCHCCMLQCITDSF